MGVLYMDEYRRMQPEEVTGYVNENGIAHRESPLEPWEIDGAPIGTEKSYLSYEDFMYDQGRIERRQRWNEINRNHFMFGCSLEPAEDGSWGPCVIHGMYKGERILTYEEFMGSYLEERPS